MIDTMRERLARRLRDHQVSIGEAREGVPWKGFLGDIDAILAELAEPSEGMLKAGSQAIQYLSGQSRPEKIAEVHRAMIQHIRDGGS